ncbi:DUF2786 domain-containing protein [Nonomuraea sp. NPDC049480]|uniref:DUF2786 domain-containing protein n=1 Tax=Nonomuraea sp. NPDC049480 TaxID=3364353 RepID=UPI0037AFC925
MTTAPEKTLERIRKYLAIAEHPNTGPEEAETYRDRAYNLMASYGIERAHLAAAGQITDELSSWALAIDKTHQAERIQFLAAITNAKTCRTLSWKVNDTTYLMVSGYQSDLEVVKMLFASLSLQWPRRSRPSPAAGARASPAPARASCSGSPLASARSCARPTRPPPPRLPTTSTGRSTELVLRDRQAAVDDYFNRQAPHTRASKGPKIRDTHAYLAGREAGDRADLGGGARLGSSGQRAINA